MNTFGTLHAIEDTPSTVFPCVCTVWVTISKHTTLFLLVSGKPKMLAACRQREISKRGHEIPIDSCFLLTNMYVCENVNFHSSFVAIAQKCKASLSNAPNVKEKVTCLAEDPEV